VVNGSNPTDFSNIAKVLSGSVAVVVAAAGALGATTGGLAFLYRNEPPLVGSSLVLGFLAAVCATIVSILPSSGRPPAGWWIRAGLFGVSFLFLAAALVLVLVVQYKVQQVTSRPVITAEWGTAGGGLTLKTTVEADSLAKDDQLWASVGGFDRATKRPLTFYAGKTGPDSTGKARQQQTVAIQRHMESAEVETVYVVGVVVGRDSLNPGDEVVSVNCSGEVLVSNPRDPASVTRPAGRSVGEPACSTLKTLPSAEASPTPR
jgi:hypothetical protein